MGEYWQSWSYLRASQCCEVNRIDGVSYDGLHRNSRAVGDMCGEFFIYNAFYLAHKASRCFSTKRKNWKQEMRIRC